MKKTLQMKKLVSMLLIATSLCTMLTVEAKEVRLEDDFYTAMNKEWLQSSKIKPGYTQTSTFTELSDQSRDAVAGVFEEVIHKVHQGEATASEKMMVTLYENYLDREERDNQGSTPVEPYLEAIQDTKDLESLTALLSEEEMSVFNGLYSFHVVPDMSDSNQQTVTIASTALQLVDADHYTQPTALSKTMKEATIVYLKELFQLVGYEEDEAFKKVGNIFELEKKLAESMLGTQAITTHPNIYEAINNVYTVEALEALAPRLGIAKVMKKLGCDQAPKIILQEPKWLETLDSLYIEENLPLLKDYAEAMVLKESANYLDKSFIKAQKRYMGTLYGVTGDLPIEQEAFGLVSQAFEDAIGKLYVEKYFAEEDKVKVEALVQEIIQVYKQRITKLEWMSKETKENAILKLDTMRVKIGYPSEWEDYKGLSIKSYEEGSNLLENIIQIKLYQHKEALGDMKKPVNKDIFLMPPHMVNACYSPSSNDITFPAAILQPPFYDPDASKETNMGAIGMVIAHEITHAFDTTGARFDEIGNLKNWWTEKDYKKFEEKAKEVRSFYSNIEVLPGQYVNGDLTVGENIADIGAMACMLDILETKEDADYKAFFESWASVWRIVTTEAFEKQLLTVDSHAPGKVRVNAVLMQFEPFYKTYGIKPTDKMYIKEEDRLKVW